jgi:hypothetical protein
LQRTRRDKRARPLALRITLLLTYLVAYVLFVLLLEVNTASSQGIWSAAFYAFIFGIGTIAAILIR